MKSTLQTEIAQVVYVALGTSCKELFPIMDKVSVLCDALNIPNTNIAHMHVKVHEDNVDELTLTGLEP
jgi:hypothetical protein